VLHIEHRRQQFPHAAAGKKILFEGAGQKALNSLNKPDQSFARTRQLDGRGEIIGISDTGIDWDNCYVWESTKSATFLERGQKPPLNVVDMARRKIVGYDFLSDCNVCAMCLHQVGPDRKGAEGTRRTADGKDKLDFLVSSTRQRVELAESRL